MQIAVQKLLLRFSSNLIFTTYLQDYPAKAQHKVQYIFLFERASKTAGALKLRFYNVASVLVQKRDVLKTIPVFFVFFETLTFLLIFFLYWGTIWKNGHSQHLQFLTLFQTKKISLCSIKFHREFLQRRSAIFDPWLLWIFLKTHNIDLNIFL